MIPNLHKRRILLASSSPRRQDLLKSIGYNFDVVIVDCDETYPDTLPTEDVAAFVAEAKANAYDNIADDEILITSDTIVVLNNEILLKPKSKVDALEMLNKLSNNTHLVYTAICIKTTEETITKTDCAKVNMGNISAEEAEFYIDQYRPFDKAGSYGVQEWLGMAKIKSIIGSYYTIMGLPTHLVYQHLSKYTLQD